MYSSILVPLSFADDSQHAAAVAVARRLAEPGARIVLLHVMEDAPPYAIAYMPQGYREELKRAVRGEMAKLAAGDAAVSAEVAEGRASTVILERAEAAGCDCIVIASHRPGLRDYFLGSTAAHVVRHAVCSVHVLR